VIVGTQPAYEYGLSNQGTAPAVGNAAKFITDVSRYP
jgi:hypothetical protein